MFEEKIIIDVDNRSVQIHCKAKNFKRCINKLKELKSSSIDEHLKLNLNNLNNDPS